MFADRADAFPRAWACLGAVALAMAPAAAGGRTALRPPPVRVVEQLDAREQATPYVSARCARMSAVVSPLAYRLTMASSNPASRRACFRTRPSKAAACY
jgi:hypothetical protein